MGGKGAEKQMFVNSFSKGETFGRIIQIIRYFSSRVRMVTHQIQKCMAEWRH